MKRFYRLTIAFLASAALLCGCQKSEELTAEEPVNYTDSITAVWAGTESKVADTDNGLVWQEGDALAVFRHGQEALRYDLHEMDPASRNASFRTSEVLKETKDFVNYNVAFYPYSTPVTLDNGTLSFTLPGVQQYDQSGFLGEYFPMSATTEFSFDTEYTFQNICSVLLFQLTGKGDTVDSLILKGNNGEALYGDVSVIAAYGEAPAITFKNTEEPADTCLTLDCTGKDVVLGEVATKFWFVVPPTVFTEGITLEIVTSDGYHGTVSTEKEVTVSRSEQLIMAPVDYLGKPNYPTPVIGDPVVLGNTVTLSWDGDQEQTEVELEKYILNYGEESKEIPGDTKEITLTLEPNTAYQFELRAIPADTTQCSPSLPAFCNASTGIFSIGQLNELVKTFSPDLGETVTVDKAYEGYVYEGVISANNLNNNFNSKLGVQNIDADGPNQGMTLYDRNKYNTDENYPVGGIIRITLTSDSEIQNFNGLYELKNVDDEVAADAPVTVKPLPVDLADYDESYCGMYVKISNLAFKGLKDSITASVTTWYNADNAHKGNTYFGDSLNTLLVYNGSSVPWKDSYINPSADFNGSISGVVTYYNQVELCPLYVSDIAEFNYTPALEDESDYFYEITKNAGYNKNVEVTTVSDKNNQGPAIEFKGTGIFSPTYYANGDALRFYAGNTLTIKAAKPHTIKKIEISTTQGGNNLSVENGGGKVSSENRLVTWTGSNASVVFKNTSSSQTRIRNIKVWVE